MITRRQFLAIPPATPTLCYCGPALLAADKASSPSTPKSRPGTQVILSFATEVADEPKDFEHIKALAEMLTAERALFDKLGMRDMVLETDPYENFLLQGYEFGSARDWSRLGNLYLQDGMWNGERLLPKNFVDFVSTLAPAWAADGRPIYGGFFWINGTERFPIPKDAYYMAGAGGQYTIIIPSHDLVVVRMGHYKGSSAGFDALRKSLGLLMQAVPHKSQ